MSKNVNRTTRFTRLERIRLGSKKAQLVDSWIGLSELISEISKQGFVDMRSLLSGLETTSILKEVINLLISFWRTDDFISVYPHRNPELLVGQSETTDLAAELVQGRNIPAKNYPVANNNTVVSLLENLYELILEVESWMKSSDPDQNHLVLESVTFLRDSVKGASKLMRGDKPRTASKAPKPPISQIIKNPPKFTKTALKTMRKNGFYFGRKSRRKGSHQRRPR